MRVSSDITVHEPASPGAGVAMGNHSGEVIFCPGSMDGRVLALQSKMVAMTEHHIIIEPTHTFAQGLYAREVTLPAGSTAVGYRHTQEHICIISKGRVQVVTEDGTREIVAPATMIIPAGRKNCVHAIEETVWTTIHASDAATPDEAFATLVMPEEIKCLS